MKDVFFIGEGGDREEARQRCIYIEGKVVLFYDSDGNGELVAYSTDEDDMEIPAALVRGEDVPGFKHVKRFTLPDLLVRGVVSQVRSIGEKERDLGRAATNFMSFAETGKPPATDDRG